MTRAALLLLALATPASAQDLAVPNVLLTPGAVDPSATLDVICNRGTRERRHVSPATRAAVLEAYGVTDMQSVGMEVDHSIPLCLGGSNDAANLWVQPGDEAAIKDVCEATLCARVCYGSPPLALSQMQEAVAADWVTACRRYGQ